MTSLSLATAFPWPQVMNLLGVPVSSDALPAHAQCPICHQRQLKIYHDTIRGSTWHYCFGCHSAGDMISLAAATWGSTVLTAIPRLAHELGVKIPETREIIIDRMRRFDTNRLRVRAFWTKASEYLYSGASNELNSLRSKFRIHWYQDKPRWKLGPHRMLGASYAAAIAEAFHGPNCRSYDYGVVGELPGIRWREVLVIPYYGAPEQLSAFMFVGREGLPKDILFRPVNRPPHARERCNAGITNWWAVEESRKRFDSQVLVLDDPLLALRLQLRHYGVSNSPLPIVAFADRPGATTNRITWMNLGCPHPVFWGFRLTPAILHQAIISDGMISIAESRNPESRDPGVDMLDSYVQNNSSVDILRRAFRRAKPWRIWIREWVEEARSGEIEDLVAAMLSYPGDVDALKLIDGRFSGRSVEGASRIVEFDGYSIIERGDEWYYLRGQKNEIRVMNAVLRIDRTAIKSVGTHPDTACYEGAIIYQGHTVPFCMPVSLVRGRFIYALKILLAKSVPGAILTVAPGWSLRLANIALRFRHPEMV